MCFKLKRIWIICVILSFMVMLILYILQDYFASKKDEIQIDYPKTYINSLGIEFVLIPAGQFLMGTEGVNGRMIDDNLFLDFQFNEKPQHQVTIRQAFYLSKFEITQSQWELVMDHTPSSFYKGPMLPVVNVSWNDVQKFIKLLNKKEGHNRYRLPSEAEWEYAARAGSKTDYFFGNDLTILDKFAWYNGSLDKALHPVGQKSPNPWGLYDIYGNASEWVNDWYDDYYYSHSPSIDPHGPIFGFERVYRGGSRLTRKADDLRSARRFAIDANQKTNDIGFRLAISVN